jgi:glycosyltransferase involved in cell wall biosynthesis
VVCGPGERLRDSLREADVSVTVEPGLRSAPQPVTDIRVLHSLTETVSAVDPDVVHCHSTKAGALGRLAAFRASIPAVFTVHGWGFYNASPPLSHAIVLGERVLAGRTAGVVCVSDNDYEHGVEREIVDSSSARVIRNGVPAVETPDRTHLAAELSHPTTPIIGTLGRLAHQKNPLATLRVVRALDDRGVQTTGVLIGSGPLLEPCRGFSTRHDLDIHLLGYRADAHELLAGLDVFVLPSHFEGLPLTVLEAMHRAVPVVAYDVGGVAEAVVDGETGFVVPPGDEEALVDQVRRLVEDPDRRATMGTNARERARREFTADRMCDEYETVYHRVAGGTSP